MITTVDGKRIAVFFKYEDETTKKGKARRYVTCIVCPARNTPEEKVEPIAVGAVDCAPKDYVKTKMRNKALGKTLLKAFPNDRALRSQIWNQVNSERQQRELAREAKALQARLGQIQNELVG